MISLAFAHLCRPSQHLFAIRGISSTLVRSPVKLFYNDVYEVLLPAGHRFPMAKYRMVRQALQAEYADHPYMVLFQVSPVATSEELASTHCPTYINRYLTGQMTEREVRKTGFPWSQEHVRRSTSSVGGTVAAMRYVMQQPNALFAGHIAGGTHHAFYDYGEGFCIFSDIAVAANLALMEHGSLQRVLIVDLDVHQGNGNARLFQNCQRVFTFSVHCANNIFSARQTSDLDIELPAGTGDEAYLACLQSHLPALLDRVQPELVFFQAGVDIFDRDKLGKLKVSRAGLQRRNRIVFQQLLQRNIKCVITMGGGYPRDLEESSEPFNNLVQCHADVYRNCLEEYREHMDGCRW